MMHRGRSRKRQRPKTQRDYSCPIIKKARNIKFKIEQPKSDEIETINENVDLQPVSEYKYIPFDISILGTRLICIILIYLKI